MVKIPYPKGLRLTMLKNAEKFSSIASAISFKSLHIFYSFYRSVNFKCLLQRSLMIHFKEKSAKSG
jgi:hypothetical protein